MQTLVVRLVPLLLRLAMDPALRRALPLIYARLDGELGLWAQEALGAGAVQGRLALIVRTSQPPRGQLSSPEQDLAECAFDQSE